VIVPLKMTAYAYRQKIEQMYEVCIGDLLSKSTLETLRERCVQLIQWIDTDLQETQVEPQPFKP